MFSALPMRALGLLLPFLVLGCAAPIPTLSTFEHYNEQYEQIIATDRKMFDEKLTSGEISQDEYDFQMQKFDEERKKSVDDLVLHNHRLRESYTKNLGLPVPGFSPAVSSGHSGGSRGGGGIGSAGFGSQKGGGSFAPSAGRFGSTRLR